VYVIFHNNNVVMYLLSILLVDLWSK